MALYHIYNIRIVLKLNMNIYISFIILCYNNWSLVKQTIDTLTKSIKDSKYLERGTELLVIDNGSEERINKPLWDKEYEEIMNISFYRISLNMGYPVGINYGLSMCKGKIFCILNSDLIFTSGWFEPLINELEKNNDIGLVAPYLSNCHGEQNIKFNDSNILNIHSFAHKFMQERLGKENCYSNRVIGACMVIKKEVIDKIGGNDFWFGIGHYDDDDLCIRVRIAGYRIAIVQNSFVYHIGHASFKSLNINVANYIFSNKQKFKNKWNLDNIETSRDNCICNTNYNRKNCYIPLNINKEKLKKNKFSNESDNVLLVADWTNQESRWKEIVDKDKFNKFTLWIPRRYFNLSEINFNKSRSNYEIDSRDINPEYIASYVNSFNCIGYVFNDYVNRYIVSIANILDKNIVYRR